MTIVTTGLYMYQNARTLKMTMPALSLSTVKLTATTRTRNSRHLRTLWLEYCVFLVPTIALQTPFLLK